MEFILQEERYTYTVKHGCPKCGGDIEQVNRIPYHNGSPEPGIICYWQIECPDCGHVDNGISSHSKNI